MASVILPTRAYGSVAADLAVQLADEDELLIVCDSPGDPVANRATPDGVSVVVAGDPEGCSGKANAVAAGMEAAECERIVWTDDDFDHPEDWLQSLKRAGERHGPVSEVPVFVGNGPWWLPFEPMYVVFGTSVVTSAKKYWAGGCTFTRSELHDGVDALVADLRRTVSDDGTLGEHLDDCTPLVDRTREIEVDGTPRAVYQRFVRFVKISYFHDPPGTLFLTLAVTLLAGVAALWPFVLAPAATAFAYWYYRRVGLDRSTWVLAFPSLLLIPLQFVVGLLAPTFEWGGRRYRWRGKFDVEVLETGRRN